MTAALRTMIRSFLVVGLLSAITSSCGLIDDRNAKARDHLADRVSTESGGALRLDDFTKIDGYDREIAGMKLSVLEWQADITAQQVVWKTGDFFVGYWQTFQVSRGPIVGLGAGNQQRFSNGAQIRLTGDLTLHKTDQGWRVEDVTVKTSQVMNEGFEFLGEWQAFYVNYGRAIDAATGEQIEQEIEETQPSFDITIDRDGTRYRITRTRIGSTEEPQVFFATADRYGRLIAEGRPEDFYKLQVPTVQVTAEGSLRLTEGVGDLILKRRP